MSYNIDTVKIIQCTAWMHADDIADILENHEDELPESCFLYDLRDQAEAARSVTVTCECGQKNKSGSRYCNKCGKRLPKSKSVDHITLKNISWSGEGSGSTWEFFRSYVAPKIDGKVQAIVIWEGGDTVSGIAIKDGCVREPDVIQTLDLPKDW